MTHTISERIPTIILTGFLGAGKTTLLNRLIEHYNSERTVLLINEFGQVGIDGELLADGNYEKIELNKGSLFCICVRTDFIFEVERIARDVKPELLIIEATGLADTSEMEKMLALPNLREAIELQACLCVVDCQNFLKITEFLNAPVSQVKHADLALINKIDLVPEEQVEEVMEAVREIAPDIPVFKTSFVDFPLEQLRTIRHPDIHAVGEPGEGRPDPVASFTLEADGRFTQESWDAFIALITPEIMRFKGFLTLEDETFHVDATGESWSMTPTTKIAPGTNRLVVIGQRFREEQLEQAFQTALQER